MLLTGLLLMACPAFIYDPGPPTQEWALPQVSLGPDISIINQEISIRLNNRQSDGHIFQQSIFIPDDFSWYLVGQKITKTQRISLNTNFTDSARQDNQTWSEVGGGVPTILALLEMKLEVHITMMVLTGYWRSNSDSLWEFIIKKYSK